MPQIPGRSICLICEAMSGAFISVNSVEKTDMFSNLTSRCDHLHNPDIHRCTCVHTMTCSPYKDTLSGRSQVIMRIARGLSCSPLSYLSVKCTSRMTLSPPIKLIQVKTAPFIEDGCNGEVG